MRTLIDIAPLYRPIVGFDRMFPALHAAMQSRAAEEWPPFDILARDEDSYRITMAVPGFREAEVSITQAPNLLVIEGRKPAAEASEARYLYRGMPAPSFERRFELADHVSVENAHLADGLLTIDLKREIPEGAKPRRIAITSEADPTQGQAPSLSAPETKGEARAA